MQHPSLKHHVYCWSAGHFLVSLAVNSSDTDLLSHWFQLVHFLTYMLKNIPNVLSMLSLNYEDLICRSSDMHILLSFCSLLCLVLIT
jgi:hypothetical protein